jgi:hypothetical protein
MTKDLSRRSSVTGSTHAPSPRENGNAETPQSGDHSPHISQSSSALPDTTKGVPAANSTAVADSQPMTASNSTSSNPPPSDMGAYGTRSRNRTGRPNYAEDKELDTEFDMMISAKETNGRKASRAVDSTNSDSGRAPTSTRKNAAPEVDQNLIMQNQLKESIPGTLTFSANPSSTVGQSSKKRKAANQQSTATSNLQASHQASLNGVPTPQAVTRRASMAAHIAGGFRESNMVSFDNCGSRLKAKKLVADDGTVFQVNGELYP